MRRGVERQTPGRAQPPPKTLPNGESQGEKVGQIVAAMAGEKGSSDKESGSKKREESPEPEDGRKRGFCRFPLLVAVLQLLLGAAVTVVAFLTLAISPSLLARETPHWAGIIVSSPFSASACLNACAYSDTFA